MKAQKSPPTPGLKSTSCQIYRRNLQRNKALFKETSLKQLGVWLQNARPTTTATLGSLLPMLLAPTLPSQRVLMLFSAGILMIFELALSATPSP